MAHGDWRPGCPLSALVDETPLAIEAAGVEACLVRVPAEVWSVTSGKQLRDDALAVERWSIDLVPAALMPAPMTARPHRAGPSQGRVA